MRFLKRKKNKDLNLMIIPDDFIVDLKLSMLINKPNLPS